jgi:hippurate hydrolase
VTALQSIASRNADPLKSVVVSATMFHAGSAFNIIPQRAQLTGTVRTLEPGMRDLAEQRLRDIVAGVCRTFGAEASVDYERGYPATINHPEETRFAAEVARKALGADFLDEQVAPMMGGEDFSFMLLERPGAYVFIGNGNSAGLHHPAYDFNDDVLPYGMQFWTELAKARTEA